MRQHRIRQWLATATLGFVLAGAALIPSQAQANSRPWRHDQLNLAVTVGVDGVRSATIHAIRYTPTGRIRGVQILVPGVTYDHHYFDLQTSRGTVSQAREAAQDGWVSIAVDRIGTGQSSKPAAASDTTAVQVASLAHFVDTIGNRYRRLPLVLVGHSYGSVVAEGVAARSHAVDALVVTGFLYRQSSPSFTGFPALTPAATDPTLAHKTLPANYLTTAPNSRGFFYYLPNANRTTLAADERTKSTTTAAEVPGFTAEFTSRVFAGKVPIPVLVVVGDHDFLYRGDDRAAFAPDQKEAFASAPSVDAGLIPNAAHDLALQRNAPHTTALINRWALAQTR